MTKAWHGTKEDEKKPMMTAKEKSAETCQEASGRFCGNTFFGAPLMLLIKLGFV